MKKLIKLAAMLFSIILFSTSCEKDDENDVDTVIDTTSIDTSTVIPIDTTIIATDFSITIDENPVNGLLLGELQSTVSIEGLLIAYELIEVEDYDAFELSDDFNKKLKVADSILFDYEIRQTVTAKYEAVIYEEISIGNGIKTIDRIIARDTATITITLNDIDDTPRVILDDITASIEEGAVYGDFIADIAYRFENTEPTNNIAFSIIDVSVSNAVTSGIKNGMVGTNEYTLEVSTNAAAFDYETNTTITGKLVASAGDNGVMKDTADFTINIIDTPESLSTLLNAGDYQEALDDDRFTIRQVYDTLIFNNIPANNLIGLNYGGGSIYKIQQNRVSIVNYSASRFTSFNNHTSDLATLNNGEYDDWFAPNLSDFTGNTAILKDILPNNRILFTSQTFYSSVQGLMFYAVRLNANSTTSNYLEIVANGGLFHFVVFRNEDF